MEEKNIITLTDDKGNNMEYELLDIIEYDEKIYTVFYPTEEGDTEVIILRAEDTENLDESRYIVEQDEKIIQNVYEIFKEKYKDEIDFID